VAKITRIDSIGELLSFSAMTQEFNFLSSKSSKSENFIFIVVMCYE
jgi:hypothetical protein